MHRIHSVFEIDVILDEYQTNKKRPNEPNKFEIDVILDEYQTVELHKLYQEKFEIDAIRKTSKIQSILI